MLLIHFTFLLEALPPSFHYSLGIFFLVKHFTKSKLIARSVPALKLPEKCIIPFSRNMSVTRKSRVSLENVGIKVSALPPN